MTKTQKEFKQITLLMGGAGGAVPFVTLQRMIVSLEKQAAEGDFAAAEILGCVAQFAAMCVVAAKQCGCEEELR